MPSLAQLLGESPAISDVREQVHGCSVRRRRGPPAAAHPHPGRDRHRQGAAGRAIHRAGARAGGPFVDLNCAAIPETLLEAELFGFERGAFTDARQAKPGCSRRPTAARCSWTRSASCRSRLQSKLLKAIEERSVRRLGSTRSEAHRRVA